MAAFAPGRLFVRNARSTSLAGVTGLPVCIRNCAAPGRRRHRPSGERCVSRAVSGANILHAALARPGALSDPLSLFLSGLDPAVLNQSADIAQVKIKNPPPIVLVIFDEFSSISLMDENHRIDARRYPNFAAFAQDATWFRNASSMSTWTPRAVPAILTGSYPIPNRLPNVAGYPHNIFTLLGGTYTVRVHGTITELCPHELCTQLREPWGTRMQALLSDVSIVYLHILLPEDQNPACLHFKHVGKILTWSRPGGRAEGFPLRRGNRSESR